MKILKKLTVSACMSLVALTVSGALHAQEVNKPDAQRGEQLYTSGDAAKGIIACVACHGPGGQSVVEIYPHLAGQHYNYIVAQLKNFKLDDKGQAKRMTADGQPTAMSPNVMSLEPQDMADIAAYIDGLKLENPEAAKFMGDAKKVNMGRLIWRAGIPDRGVPACASCHGASGQGMPALYPRLSGQRPNYLEEQMILFADGYRSNGGPENQMGTIASRLTREQIKAVADYAAGLR
ncbi:c-type cytochrome [Brackiella oedipodis]|uniref:c-type cytochrome n=1 Tax=Brackiella oedipodis TaxID=124225 RepID=UPI00048D983D|nr:c-type cytochrome [Brackiella oedipodis]